MRITTSHGPAPVETSLDYVAPLVGQATRTGLARVFPANPDNDWKPGMFVEGQITLGEFPAAVVAPRTAVIDLEANPQYSFSTTAAGNPVRPNSVAVTATRWRYWRASTRVNAMWPKADSCSRPSCKKRIRSGHNH